MPILTTQERVGTVIDGKLRLDRVLGEGGMGVVYAGTHLRLDRPVAVKFLHPGLSQSAPSVERFLREARATSRLSHPNVVDVRDVDVASDGSVYMVLELLEGESLADYLERSGPLELEQALAILVPVMDALAAAHAAGVVHRDVKPHNVFLSRDATGRVVPKVLDFGLARFADVNVASATQSGAVMGTPLYMAPEQALGNTKAVGPCSDVWSTAVMAYECLANEPPFDVEPDAPVTAIIVAVITGDIIPLGERRPDLPVEVWEVLSRALTRKPEERLASIGELRDGLMRAAGISRVDALPATMVVSAAPQSPQREIDEMAETLAPAQPAQSGMTTGPLGHASVPQLPLARRGWLWGIGVAAVAGLAAMGIVSATTRTPAPPESRESPRSDPAPTASPPPSVEPPAPTEAPTPAIEPPSGEITRSQGPTPIEEPPAASTPRPHRRPAEPPSVAAAPEPPEPRAEPPAIAPPPPAPPAVDHRAGSVSLDDF